MSSRGGPASTFSLTGRAARPLALSVKSLSAVSGLWMLTVAST